MIFIIKVSANKEDQAVDLISDRVTKKNLSVYSIARPHGLRGYILMEADSRDTVEEACFDLPYVKNMLPKTVEYDEVKSMIEPEVTSMNIEKGDIVEIIAEPFKKEKAKIPPLILKIAHKKKSLIIPDQIFIFFGCRCNGIYPAIIIPWNNNFNRMFKL